MQKLLVASIRLIMKLCIYTGVIQKRKIQEFIVKTILFLLGKNKIFILNNCKFKLNLRRDGIYYLYFDLFEQKISLLIKKIIRSGDFFFDIGAHYGFYSILASKFVLESGKVFSFEPDYRNLLRLRENILLNNNKNIIIEKYAISDRNGFISFYLRADSSINSLIPSYGKKHMLQKVKTLSLDEYCFKKNISPNIVKIDVEGAELEVLNGMKEIIRQYAPILIIEIHKVVLNKKKETLIQTLNFLYTYYNIYLILDGYLYIIPRSKIKFFFNKPIRSKFKLELYPHLLLIKKSSILEKKIKEEIRRKKIKISSINYL